MYMYEATIRQPDGKEFKAKIGAENPQQARRRLQELYGVRSVPYLPKLIPS